MIIIVVLSTNTQGKEANQATHYVATLPKSVPMLNPTAWITDYIVNAAQQML